MVLAGRAWKGRKGLSARHAPRWKSFGELATSASVPWASQRAIFEAAGFPISPAGAIRWRFASGFNAPCPNGAGHLFHVGAAQLEGLFELSRRGCLDEAGAEVAFHEATVRNPDWLRFGKLCLLLGVPFSPSHREEREACIEAEVGGRQPGGEAGWISREAQAMIDAKDIAERAGPAQAPSPPAPRL